MACQGPPRGQAPPSRKPDSSLQATVLASPAPHLRWMRGLPFKVKEKLASRAQGTRRDLRFRSFSRSDILGGRRHRAPRDLASFPSTPSLAIVLNSSDNRLATPPGGGGICTRCPLGWSLAFAQKDFSPQCPPNLGIPCCSYFPTL